MKGDFKGRYRRYLQNGENLRKDKLHMRTKYLYMEVTNDEYELPLIVAESLGELSKKSGRTKCAIKNAIIRKYSGRNKGSRFVKTELIEEKEGMLC